MRQEIVSERYSVKGVSLLRTITDNQSNGGWKSWLARKCSGYKDSKKGVMQGYLLNNSLYKEFSLYSAVYFLYEKLNEVRTLNYGVRLFRSRGGEMDTRELYDCVSLSHWRSMYYSGFKSHNDSLDRFQHRSLSTQSCSFCTDILTLPIPGMESVGARLGQESSQLLESKENNRMLQTPLVDALWGQIVVRLLTRI